MNVENNGQPQNSNSNPDEVSLTALALGEISDPAEVQRLSELLKGDARLQAEYESTVRLATLIRDSVDGDLPLAPGSLHDVVLAELSNSHVEQETAESIGPESIGPESIGPDEKLERAPQPTSAQKLPRQQWSFGRREWSMAITLSLMVACVIFFANYWGQGNGEPTNLAKAESAPSSAEQDQSSESSKSFKAPMSGAGEAESELLESSPRMKNGQIELQKQPIQSFNVQNDGMRSSVQLDENPVDESKVVRRKDLAAEDRNDDRAQVQRSQISKGQGAGIAGQGDSLKSDKAAKDPRRLSLAESSRNYRSSGMGVAGSDAAGSDAADAGTPGAGSGANQESERPAGKGDAPASAGFGSTNQMPGSGGGAGGAGRGLGRRNAQSGGFGGGGASGSGPGGRGFSKGASGGEAELDSSQASRGARDRAGKSAQGNGVTGGRGGQPAAGGQKSGQLGGSQGQAMGGGRAHFGDAKRGVKKRIQRPSPDESASKVPNSSMSRNAPAINPFGGGQPNPSKYGNQSNRSQSNRSQSSRSQSSRSQSSRAPSGNASGDQSQQQAKSSSRPSGKDLPFGQDSQKGSQPSNESKRFVGPTKTADRKSKFKSERNQAANIKQTAEAEKKSKKSSMDSGTAKPLTPGYESNSEKLDSVRREEKKLATKRQEQAESKNESRPESVAKSKPRQLDQTKSEGKLSEKEKKESKPENASDPLAQTKEMLNKKLAQSGQTQSDRSRDKKSDEESGDQNDPQDSVEDKAEDDNKADVGDKFAAGRIEVIDPSIENPFIQPLGTNALSTFSADTDTAAYTNIRRMLREGKRPHPEDVRIEEMVNYFDYQYGAPKPNERFSVTMEMASSPWSLGNKILRVGLKAREYDNLSRPPSNIVLLVDVSGSMRGANKLPLLKQGLHKMVDQLREDDYVSIVTYSSVIRTPLGPTDGSQKLKIKKVIDSLSAVGSTNGGQGLQTAYRLAEQNFLKNGTNRIVMGTDGDFNVGISDDRKLAEFVREKAQSGVYLTICGFGSNNFQDQKMQLMSQNGNGKVFYIDTEAEAQRVFADRISGSLVTIAKDVKFQMLFNPRTVQAYRLIGYENRMLAAQDFDDDRKDAGEMDAGDRVTVLYEIIPADSELTFPTAAAADNKVDLKYQVLQKARYELTKVSESNDIAALRIRFKEPNSEKSELREFVVKDNDVKFNRASEDFKFASTVAGFGLMLRGSHYRGSLNFAGLKELGESSLLDGQQKPKTSRTASPEEKLQKRGEVRLKQRQELVELIGIAERLYRGHR